MLPAKLTLNWQRPKVDVAIITAQSLDNMSILPRNEAHGPVMATADKIVISDTLDQVDAEEVVRRRHLVLTVIGNDW